jgi:hypothetical protein
VSGYADLLGDPPQEEEPQDEPRPSPDDPAWQEWTGHHDDCPWDDERQDFTQHTDDCPYPEFDPAQWAPKPTAETAPPKKSRRRGRIHDRESSRAESDNMREVALNDDRLNPCDLFVYGHANAAWRRAGSVYVVLKPDFLSRRSGYDPDAGTGFSPDQCKRSLKKLCRIGYMELMTKGTDADKRRRAWLRVKKKDPGLYEFIKRQRAHVRGTWPNAYHMKQDLPMGRSEDDLPDEENPAWEAFGIEPPPEYEVAAPVLALS